MENSAHDNSQQVTSPLRHAQITPPKLQSSYSANDVPTMRNSVNGGAALNTTTTPNTHAQQHLQNHNASLGRIPPNALNNRLSREIASPDAPSNRDAAANNFQSLHSALQASAAPFGPALTQSLSPTTPVTVTSSQPYTGAGYYNNGGYNMQAMTMGMQNMQMGTQVPQNIVMQNPYNNFGPTFPVQNGARDSQSRVIQQRRQGDGDGTVPCPSTKLPLILV